MKRIHSHTIFLALAIAGILLLSILTYLSYRAINTEGITKDNITRFYNINHYLTNSNTVIFIILLFVSSIMFIRQHYWDTFVWTGIIFFTFTLIDWWWLSELIFHYKKKNGFWEGETNLAPFLGVIIATFGLGAAISDYYILKLFYKDKKPDTGNINQKPESDFNAENNKNTNTID